MGKRSAQQSKQKRIQRQKLWQRRRELDPICRCGKVIFHDKVAADMALTRTVGRRGSIRSYECTVVLGNWHTTSQPPRSSTSSE